MSIHNLREKPANAAEAEHQWKGTMIRDGAQRDTVEDRGRRSACVAGGSRSCFTTADRLNLLAGFQYLILDLRRSASVRSHDDRSPELVGRLMPLHIRYVGRHIAAPLDEVGRLDCG